MAFSTFEQLVAADTNVDHDIYLKNLATGETTLVSADADGNSLGKSYAPSVAIAGNGAVHVAFQSYAASLPGANGFYQIYVKHMATGLVELASSNVNGDASADGARAPAMVVDSQGNVFVVFESYNNNLVPDQGINGYNVFVKNLGTGAIQIASANAAGVPANTGNNGSYRSSLAVAPNGAILVAFQSLANNLIPGLEEQIAGQVYVKNLTTGDITLASANADGVPANYYSHYPSLAIAPDGSVFVAFQSGASNLVPGEYYGGMYVKNVTTGSILRVGGGGGREAGLNELAGQGPVSLAITQTGILSLAFTSYQSDLVVGDYQYLPDVFVWRHTDGGTSIGG
ncbi:MAG: hypothetical protein NZ518_04835, partial [Dehalococcoidia bacterium]|nr:hypothetical protein [Dehalococcoidia bacterium]